jgi:diguanylate cyclase (GGDEF)-like protein
MLAAVHAEPVHHILLVEDSEDDALLVQAELRKLNRPIEFRRVDCANDMQAALKEQAFDMVISDHRMPKFDSIRALNVLKRSPQQIPFVIMSGTLPADTAATAMKLGAHDYIDKANRSRLLPVVERELRHSRMLRAKESVERNLVRLTYHDALTDLPNTQMLAKLIAQTLRESATERSALVLLDLDRFMRINESFGHDQGDALLKAVSQRLLENFAREAAIARLGQDKFALFFQHLNSGNEALHRASAVLESFTPPFELGGEEVYLGCTLGVCVYPEDAYDAVTLLHRAECAMFEAKRAGRRSITRYRGETGNVARETLRLESALRHAADRGELFLEYQPCVEASTRQIVGTEALVRWRHPQLGVLPPDRFIRLADETGLIVDIGRWVLMQACRQRRAWDTAGIKGLVMSVNVSAAQFHMPQFSDDVAHVLMTTGVAPDTLQLEITETALMRDAETTIGTLRRLKRMGVQLSVDDFGTGYSSLSYLKRFPIDILKIDRSFVSNVQEDADNQAIVRTIIALAKTLKLAVVAEGVETERELDFLRAEGCDRLQGYLVGRPVAAEEVLRGTP